MKKCIFILCLLAFLSFVLQIAVNALITEKDAVYVLKTSGNKYSIVEKMSSVDGITYYDFTVSDQDDLFYTFSFKGDFNKQTEVIENIKSFNSGDVKCIFPIYKKNMYDNIFCIKNNEQVSYSYLRQINNEDVSKITTQLKNKKFNNDSWNRKASKTTNLILEDRGIQVYQNNILDGYTFLIWRYNGLYILKHNESVIKEFLEHEQYENDFSALVGRYYISADVSGGEKEVSHFVYYNTKEMGKGELTLTEPISNNFYFNGVYKNKLYITDMERGKQYSIEPGFQKVEEIGNSSSKFISVENGKSKKVMPGDFLSDRVIFTNEVKNNKIIKKYGKDTVIVEERGFYYFKTDDGCVYRAPSNNVEHDVLLFKLDNLVDWKVKNGDVLAVSGDTVYFYSDSEGLMPIAINTELKYNYKNICDFWKE